MNRVVTDDLSVLFTRDLIYTMKPFKTISMIVDRLKCGSKCKIIISLLHILIDHSFGKSFPRAAVSHQEWRFETVPMGS